MQRTRLALSRWLSGRRRPSRRAARPGSRKRRVVVALVCPAAILFLFYIWTDTKIKPIVEQMAVTRVHYLAGQSINEAINDVMSEEAFAYGDLIFFEKDIEGRISAIKTNVAGINKLKANISRQVLDRIENIESSELRVPIGSVFRNDLLTGRGPSIQVRLIPIGSVNVHLENVFTSAGINQTRHQIIMVIRVDMGVAAWGNTVETQVTSDVVVAETVIVGNVPDFYSSIGDEVFG